MEKIIKKKKDIEYYLNLPYQYVVIPEESGGFSIKVKELPGCNAFGENIDEAYKNIKESMKIWLSEVIKQKLEIPLPESLKDYSGKFIIRISKSLHKKLVESAEKENISLNQYIQTLLIQGEQILNIKKELENIKEQLKIFEKKFNNSIFNKEYQVSENNLEKTSKYNYVSPKNHIVSKTTKSLIVKASKKQLKKQKGGNFGRYY